MHKIYYLSTGRRSSRKFFILSLFIGGMLLFTSLFAITEKAYAQLNVGQTAPPRPIVSLSSGIAVAPERILNLLISGAGRWFEFRPELPMCQIYDFKPTGIPGQLRVTRESYSFNTFLGTNECQFGRGPIFTVFSGVASLVNS